MSDSTLKELWQQVAEKKSCEAKQKELTAQRDTLADRLKKLEKSKLAEQADVDRLEGHSLAAFFYQVIGKMDEKLDKERQEAYAARVKYDAALHDLSSVDADLAQIQNRLARLSDCERQYQAALSEKIKSIKASAHPAAQQVAESESRIAALKVQKRELLEAINAGKTALHTVNEVLETLDNAEGWSTWDVMGGGLMADLAKYEELDDAQEQIEQLQVELRRFKTELSDVEITADLQVTVDSFLKFADFFFDGLFADWAVLDHINQAQSRVENTKSQIKRVLALLKKMREDIDVKSLTKKKNRSSLRWKPTVGLECLCMKRKFPKILDVAIHSINLILINYALSNMMAFFRSSLLYILFFTSEMWVFVQYRKNIEELSDSKALANLLLIICVAIEIGLLYFFGIVSGELIPFKIKW